jgi:hypothetical protein
MYKKILDKGRLYIGTHLAVEILVWMKMDRWWTGHELEPETEVQTAWEAGGQGALEALATWFWVTTFLHTSVHMYLDHYCTRM